MSSVVGMTSIDSITLEVADLAAAEKFYASAFGLGSRLALRQSDSPTTGFRGFTLSLVVSQPATVDSLVGSALAAGATEIKPGAKSLWGYGGVVQAPDGTIWKAATSSKRNTGPDTGEIDDLILLLGATDVAASKQFYVDNGLTVSRSFGRKYVEFDAAPGSIKLALYGRKALAKAAGVRPEGTGSHRLLVTSNHGPLTDPDNFTWTTSVPAVDQR